jgi:hypothetical protein
MSRLSSPLGSLGRSGFQTSKGEPGLDHYQVRQHTGWYRRITLFDVRAHLPDRDKVKKEGHHTGDSDLTALSPKRDQTPLGLPGLHPPVEPRTRPEPLTPATLTPINREAPRLLIRGHSP